MGWVLDMKSPDLRWDAACPHHVEYGDSYFSDAGGPAESEHVFIQNNQLADRFSQLSHASFAIGELGFGTGLNFLLTWQLWRERASPAKTLDFVSVEAEPLTTEQLAQAQAPWTPLSELASELRDACSDLHPGFNLRVLDGGRVRLLLLVGDVSAMLPELQAKIDAWFLDGFSPAKNPAMWSDETMREVARLSRSDATFSTYSVAGSLRKALIGAGFDIEKRPGFGRKREMLAGCYSGQLGADDLHSEASWWCLPSFASPNHVTVIGAGLAGATTARALAERGVTVEVIDTVPEPACGASAMPGMLVRPYPERGRSPAQQLYVAAAAHSVPRLADRESWRDTPVLRLDAASADEFSVSEGGDRLIGQRLHPAGQLDPIQFCREQLAHPNIECQFGRHVNAAELPMLARESAVVLANGSQLGEIYPSAEWPHVPVRGQMLRFKGGPGRPIPEAAVCFDGHCLPLGDDLLVGSSFVRNSRSLSFSQTEADHLLQKFSDALPELASAWAAADTEHYCGIRLATKDHLPLLGPVMDSERWRAFAERFRQGHLTLPLSVDDYIPGVWVHAGLGARGATSALLCSELLASQMVGQVLPMEKSLLRHLHPARFMVRQMQRVPRSPQESLS